MVRLLLLAAVVLIPTPALRAAVTLVDQGKARCVIVVDASIMAPDKKLPAKTHFPTAEAELQRQRLRESARDLAHYLGKMSGATIEIVNDTPAASDSRTRVFIGAKAAEVFGPVGKTAPYKQAFRTVVSPKGVGLYGESDLASSYAIFEVLDRLGCRWYMPSEMGEVIPDLKTIALDEADFASAPGTIYRGVWYADEAYRRRNRHGGLQLNAGHALEGYISAEDREKHPEWRAEIKGQPHAVRLKLSSQGLADAIASKILDRHALDGKLSYSLSPADGSTWDDTPADAALDGGDFDPTFQGVSMTDRLLHVANQVAAKVTAKEPDVLLGLLAYARYTRPPLRESVHPAIVPQIAPITYSRAHPMTDDRVPGNTQLRYLVEGWGKKARMTSIYMYGWFLAEPSAPNPMLTKWGTDVPYVLQHNAKLWQPETQPNFETSMHALYLGCRLAWNPALKPQDIFDEMHAKFYGRAAKEMTAYWQHIDDVWVKTHEYSGCGFGYLRRWTPEQLAKARTLLDAAKAACGTDMEKRRVQLADDSLTLFDLFMKLRRDQAEGRFETLAADAARWRTRIKELGDQYQDQFCFTRNRGKEGKTLAGSYFGSFYQRTYDDASRIAKDFRILTTPPVRTFRYQIDPEKTGEAAGWANVGFRDAGWKTTDVSVDTWSSIGQHDYFKSMWYRAEVELPAVSAGKKLHLWLGSTDGTAKVFVNGQHVPYRDEKGIAADEAKGYCKPFSFDVTGAAKPGEKNTIAILCTRTFFNELGTGGLLAPVVVYAEK